MCNCVLCRCGYLHRQFCEHQERNCVHKSNTYFNTSVQHSRGGKKNGILSVVYWLWTKFWLPWVEAPVQKIILKQQRKTCCPLNHLEWVLCKPTIICMVQGLFPTNNHDTAQHLMEPKVYSMCIQLYSKATQWHQLHYIHLIHFPSPEKFTQLLPLVPPLPYCWSCNTWLRCALELSPHSHIPV